MKKIIALLVLFQGKCQGIENASRGVPNFLWKQAYLPSDQDLLDIGRKIKKVFFEEQVVRLSVSFPWLDEIILATGEMLSPVRSSCVYKSSSVYNLLTSKVYKLLKDSSLRIEQEVVLLPVHPCCLYKILASEENYNSFKDFSMSQRYKILTLAYDNKEAAFDEFEKIRSTIKPQKIKSTKLYNKQAALNKFQESYKFHTIRSTAVECLD